jgi:phosphate starvation-inducible protein PhoH
MTVLERTSKKQRRADRRQGGGDQQQRGLQLKHIKPLTNNQVKTFDSYAKDKNLMLHGTAGTGKTFILMYLALNEILSEYSTFNKIVIIRSVVPSRDMGFLPGSAATKAAVYEAPYYGICSELFGRGDAYDILKNKGLIEFQTTSFVRGITFNNAIVIVDELQNLSFHENDSIITRVGENCKILFCGDFRQTDLDKDSEKSGILKFMRILKQIKSFDSVEFNKNDIVRSELVKQYIIAKEDLGF